MSRERKARDVTLDGARPDRERPGSDRQGFFDVLDRSVSGGVVTLIVKNQEGRVLARLPHVDDGGHTYLHGDDLVGTLIVAHVGPAGQRTTGSIASRVAATSSSRFADLDAQHVAFIAAAKEAEAASKVRDAAASRVAAEKKVATDKAEKELVAKEAAIAKSYEDLVSRGSTPTR